MLLTSRKGSVSIYANLFIDLKMKIYRRCDSVIYIKEMDVMIYVDVQLTRIFTKGCEAM